MISFEKWHSIGNDFLISKTLIPEGDIVKLCDRNFGIGADQFIVIQSNSVRFFNADGSEAEMCGNALKCVGEIVSRETMQNKFNLITKKGTIGIEILPDGFTQINLGKALEVKKINENEFFINLGNPHYVSILQNFEGDFFKSNTITQKLNEEGSIKQKEFAETRGINYSLALIDNRKNLLVRTFERGVGETLSCGSGSCASFLACYEGGIISNSTPVFNKGSKKVLAFKESFHFISYSYNNEILLRGKGTKVAEIKLK